MRLCSRHSKQNLDVRQIERTRSSLLIVILYTINALRLIQRTTFRRTRFLLVTR
jgi:hypothetical protein